MGTERVGCRIHSCSGIFDKPEINSILEGLQTPEDIETQ